MKKYYEIKVLGDRYQNWFKNKLKRSISVKEFVNLRNMLEDQHIKKKNGLTTQKNKIRKPLVFWWAMINQTW